MRLCECDGEEFSLVLQNPGDTREDIVHFGRNKFRWDPGTLFIYKEHIQRRLLNDHVKCGVRVVQVEHVHRYPGHTRVLVPHFRNHHSGKVYVGYVLKPIIVHVNTQLTVPTP